MTTLKNPQYAIVVDSGCDMPKTFYKDHQVELVPFHIRLGKDEMIDLPEAMPEDFYVRFSSKRERVVTSQPSLVEFEDVYKKLIEEGFDHIISVHMSSELSGSYQTALKAAAVFEEEDVTIEVIDSKLASAAIGFIVGDLVCMRDDGASFQDAVSHAQRMISLIKVFFIPTQKNALSNKKKFERGILASVHKFRDELFGTRFLETIDEQGNISSVTGASDVSSACALLARMMSKDAQLLGKLAYVEIYAGNQHALSFLEKPLDTNEFISHCAGVVESSPSISCYTGVGSIGITYIPEDALYNPEFSGHLAWNN